jgi:DNA polymerase-3 subunit delta'
MSNSIYPWQESSWQQLQLLRQRMPHAILFHGAAGIGKADFIEQFAQGLLCEAVLPDGHACGVCASCGWFSQQNHPDYRRVRPEALEDEPPAEGEEGEGEAKKTAKSAKAPSKEIKIEQIRNLADFMNISTHRQGLRVVVLYPAEALNMPASNALLKTLEEPPPGTVFLLASNSLDRLLPTILSRCRKFACPCRPMPRRWPGSRRKACRTPIAGCASRAGRRWPPPPRPKPATAMSWKCCCNCWPIRASKAR